MNAAQTMSHDKSGAPPQGRTQQAEYLTLYIAGQTFGVPILQVQDVLREQTVTRVPLAPPEIAGSLNLRGRIVTAMDVRKRLGMESPEARTKKMGVVVEHDHELFSLIIDDVGDVLTLDQSELESNPVTLDPMIKDISKGIFQLDKKLLVILDIPKLLETVHK